MLAACRLAQSLSIQPAPGPQLILLDGQRLPFQSLAIAARQAHAARAFRLGLTLDDLRRIDCPRRCRLRRQAGRRRRAARRRQAAGARASRSATTSARSSGRAASRWRCRSTWSGRFASTRPPPVPSSTRRWPRRRPSSTASFSRTTTGKLEQRHGPDRVADRRAVDVRSSSGQSGRCPRSQLFGIVVAQPGRRRSAARCLLTLHGRLAAGRRIAASWRAARRALTLPGGGKVEFPWSARGPRDAPLSRVAFLSDLKPIGAKSSRRWSRCRALAARQERAGQAADAGHEDVRQGTRRARPLVAHVRRRRQVGHAGRDDRHRRRGRRQGRLRVHRAGRRAAALHAADEGQRPAAGHSASTIAGREQVTLLVEPGEGLDLADHADWCDVRFIKEQVDERQMATKDTKSHK